MNIVKLHATTSTNDELKFRIRQSELPHLTTLYTMEQTRGKGQRGATWVSEKDKNLTFSILLTEKIQNLTPFLINQILSVTMVQWLKMDLQVQAKIKWPNDIQISGKKVAGVLTEMRSKREMVDFIVVGIGVNINMTRDEINEKMGKVAYIATSIKEHIGKDINRSKFAADLLLELETWYKVFSNRGKATVLTEWTKMWGDLNKRVLVNLEEDSYEGTAIGIDEKGYLMVQMDSGEINTVISGDVTVI